MQFRWAAILCLALAMTGQSAEAARSERGPVARPSAARPMPLSGPVATSRPAARVISTARGGHALRAPAARAAATRGTVVRGRDSRLAIPSSRDRGTSARFAGVSGRERGAVVSRGGAARVAGIQGRQGRGAVMRPGFNSGYQSAMLRDPGGRFASMSACSTVRGRRVCGGSRQVAMRWSGGLAPAAGSQSSCPDGTMATLAVGHENVVRCVPM